jgi:protein-L-isoaspartate(D-aspartate) O-methyltransferase
MGGRKTGPTVQPLVLITILVIVLLGVGTTGFLLGSRSFEGTTVGGPAEGDTSSEADNDKTNEDSNSADSAPKEVAYDLKQRRIDIPIESRDEFVRWVLERKPMADEELVGWRWEMAQELKGTGMINNPRLLEAFLLTPRENFCREWNIHKAYLDIWMNIGYGVTITDPSVVCRMTETILPEIDQRVLEIGTGSGYQAAILSQLSNHVYTIEIIGDLARETDTLLKEYEDDHPEYKNIKRKIDDGYYGWSENAPFDRIIVTCSIDHIPPILLRQLANNGIMIIPVGPPGTQTLLKVTKRVNTDGSISLERADVWGSPVTFVPFKDKSGNKYSKQK